MQPEPRHEPPFSPGHQVPFQVLLAASPAPVPGEKAKVDCPVNSRRVPVCLYEHPIFAPLREGGTHASPNTGERGASGTVRRPGGRWRGHCDDTPLPSAGGRAHVRPVRIECTNSHVAICKLRRLAANTGPGGQFWDAFDPSVPPWELVLLSLECGCWGARVVPRDAPSSSPPPRHPQTTAERAGPGNLTRAYKGS